MDDYVKTEDDTYLLERMEMIIDKLEKDDTLQLYKDYVLDFLAAAAHSTNAIFMYEADELDDNTYSKVVKLFKRYLRYNALPSEQRTLKHELKTIRDDHIQKKTMQHITTLQAQIQELEKEMSTDNHVRQPKSLKF